MALAPMHEFLIGIDTNISRYVPGISIPADSSPIVWSFSI